MTMSAREYFKHMTGVDILTHAKETGGRFRIKPEDLELLANDLATALPELQGERGWVGFRMPLESVTTPPVQVVTAEPNTHRCLACGREVTMIRLTTLEEPELGGWALWTDGVAWRRTKWQPQSHWWMFRWGHQDDSTPVCEDWVGPVLKEVEKRLRQFDREGRERGLPGPLQRDPSEPIVVEVTWCRHPGTE